MKRGQLRLTLENNYAYDSLKRNKNKGMLMGLRTRSEIDQEYAQCAAEYGDKLFKLSAIQTELQKQLEQIHKKMVELSKEQEAPKVDEPVDHELGPVS